MSEDFGTEPSFSEGESTPVVHESTDDLAMYRFVQSPGGVPPTNLDIPQAVTPQRVFDARVGEELTQHDLQTTEPVTQIDVPPEVFETDPEILEPTDPDQPPVSNAIKIAEPKPRPKTSRERRTVLRKLRPFLLYSLPGLALGMAVSTWVLIDRDRPASGDTKGVVAVAKPVPKAPVILKAAAVEDQAQDTDLESEVDSPESERPLARRRRVKKTAPDAVAGSGARRGSKPETTTDGRIRRLLHQARADVVTKDYAAAYLRLRRVAALLEEPKRTELKRCLIRQDLERQNLGTYSGRISGCVWIATP